MIEKLESALAALTESNDWLKTVLDFETSRNQKSKLKTIISANEKALALLATLKGESIEDLLGRVPAGRRPELLLLTNGRWACSFISDEQCTVRIKGTGETPAAAILAALEKLEAKQL